LALSEPPSSPAPAAAPEQKAEAKPDQRAEAISGLKAQIAAQRAYAEQQRAYQQHQANPVFAYLNQIPGLSAPKLQYLTAYFTAYPDRFNQEHWNTVANAHNIATREHAEDSNEYFRLVNELLHRQHAVPPPPQAAPAPPPMHEPEPEPQPMTHVDLEHVEHDHEPDEAHIAAAHVSAPVSRDPSQYAVEHQPSERSIRLTAEQRDMAARSGITEVEYAKQLLKMQKMQKSGLLK
jgi:hypothetical protein